MQSTESLLVLSFNSSLLKYGGDIAIGAMTIASSVMQFAMLPVQGLTQGSQPIVSYNYGAGNPERMKQAFVLLLKSCLTCTAVIWTFSMLCPGIFVRIFTDDPALTEAARRALRIYMAGMGIFGAQVACQQTFIALGNSRTSSFLAMLRKIILLIPFIYIMPHFFDDKVFAVFFAEPVADVLAVATTRHALSAASSAACSRACALRRPMGTRALDTSRASGYNLLWKREGSLPRMRRDKTR